MRVRSRRGVRGASNGVACSRCASVANRHPGAIGLQRWWTTAGDAVVTGTGQTSDGLARREAALGALTTFAKQHLSTEAARRAAVHVVKWHPWDAHQPNCGRWSCSAMAPSGSGIMSRASLGASALRSSIGSMRPNTSGRLPAARVAHAFRPPHSTMMALPSLPYPTHRKVNATGVGVFPQPANEASLRPPSPRTPLRHPAVSAA